MWMQGIDTNYMSDICRPCASSAVPNSRLEEVSTRRDSRDSGESSDSEATISQNSSEERKSVEDIIEVVTSIGERERTLHIIEKESGDHSGLFQKMGAMRSSEEDEVKEVANVWMDKMVSKMRLQLHEESERIGGSGSGQESDDSSSSMSESDLVDPYSFVMPRQHYGDDDNSWDSDGYSDCEKLPIQESDHVTPLSERILGSAVDEVVEEEILTCTGHHRHSTVSSRAEDDHSHSGSRSDNDSGNILLSDLSPPVSVLHPRQMFGIVLKSLNLLRKRNVLDIHSIGVIKDMVFAGDKRVFAVLEGFKTSQNIEDLEFNIYSWSL